MFLRAADQITAEAERRSRPSGTGHNPPRSSKVSIVETEFGAMGESIVSDEEAVAEVRLTCMGVPGSVCGFTFAAGLLAGSSSLSELSRTVGAVEDAAKSVPCSSCGAVGRWKCAVLGGGPLSKALVR